MPSMTTNYALANVKNLKRFPPSSENTNLESNVIYCKNPNYVIRVRGGNISDIIQELRGNLGSIDKNNINGNVYNNGLKIRLIEDNLNCSMDKAIEPAKKKLKMREEVFDKRVTLVLPNDMSKMSSYRQIPSPVTSETSTTSSQDNSRRFNPSEKGFLHSAISPCASPLMSRVPERSLFMASTKFKSNKLSEASADTCTELKCDSNNTLKSASAEKSSTKPQSKNISESENTADTAVSVLYDSSVALSRPKRAIRKPACNGCLIGRCSTKNDEKRSPVREESTYTLRPVSRKFLKSLNIFKPKNAKAQSQDNRTNSKVSSDISDAIKDLERSSLIVHNTQRSNEPEMIFESPHLIKIKEEVESDNTITCDRSESVKNSPKNCMECQKLRNEVNRQWEIFKKLETDLAKFATLTGEDENTNSSNLTQSSGYAEFQELDNVNIKLMKMVRKERTYSNDLIVRLMEREKYIKQLEWKIECISNIFKSTMNNVVTLKVEVDSDTQTEHNESMSCQPSQSNSSEYEDYEVLDLLDIAVETTSNDE